MPLPMKNGTNPFAGSVSNRRLPAFTAPSQLRQEPAKNDYRQADPLNISLQPSTNQQHQPRKGGLSISVEEKRATADPFTSPIDQLDDEITRGARNATMLSMPSPDQFLNQSLAPVPSSTVPQAPVEAPLAPNASTMIVEDGSLDSIELTGPASAQQAMADESIKTRHGKHKHETDRKNGATPDNNDDLNEIQPSVSPVSNGAVKKKAPVIAGQSVASQMASIALSLVSISAVFGIPALCISIGVLTGRLQFGLMLAGIVILLFPVVGLVMGVYGLVRKKMKTSTAVTIIVLAIMTIAGFALGFALLYASHVAMANQATTMIAGLI